MPKRIQLLPDIEISDLYARPEFNPGEQKLYFTLTNQQTKNNTTQTQNTP